MPPLKVPDSYRAGISRVGTLGQGEFRELLNALKTAPPCKSSRELLVWIAEETPSLSDADRKEIITATVSMFRVQRNAGVSPDDFADDVWDSIQNGGSSPVLDTELFKSRIAQLMAESSLDVASVRIADAKQEVERNFCKVRILTDLRPVFKEDATETPTEMAVIHNVQVGYHDGMGVHKEFYVSMDENDMSKLKSAIAEAEKRAKTLERLLGKSSIQLHR